MTEGKRSESYLKINNFKARHGWNTKLSERGSARTNASNCRIFKDVRQNFIL